jgi:rhodanese-related sulfurtransferase
MKKISLATLLFISSLVADEDQLIIIDPEYTQKAYETYLNSFTYEERKDMKINSVELTVMLEEGTAQLIDIRFKEEYEAWHMGTSINIPLNELPKRLHELDRNKLIVTACPHKDRAIMARTFLRLQGFNTRYLVDGLIGLAEYWRGDNAKEFIDELNTKE